MAVEPSLMASREYSTWKRRPSGEKVLWAWLLVLLDYVRWVGDVDVGIVAGCVEFYRWLLKNGIEGYAIK